MEKPPRKKKESEEEYAFRLSYDPERGIRLELTPEGLSDIASGIGEAWNNRGTGIISDLFGKKGIDEPGQEGASASISWDQPFMANIPHPPVKQVDEEDDGSMADVGREPTVKVEQPPVPKMPPGKPIPEDMCLHREIVLVADPNDWLDLLRDMGYRAIKRDWDESVQGHICKHCLKKVF